MHYVGGQTLASTNSFDHLCDLRRWILTPLVDSDVKLHPETRHTMPAMLTVIAGWSGCFRRIWIVMPFVEEDVKLQTEHEKGVLKSVWALCCLTLLSCAAWPVFGYYDCEDSGLM